MHGSPHIVNDVMTHTVAAIGRGATFKEIVRMMHDGKVSALPVLESEGRVAGVVSEADLPPKEEFRDSDPDRHTQLRRLSDLTKAGSLTAENPPADVPRTCGRAGGDRDDQRPHPRHITGPRGGTSDPRR